jgi:hypothetical protein
MMAKKKEEAPEPQQTEEIVKEKPRSIIVAANESGTNTIKVKTTRELYMENQ